MSHHRWGGGHYNGAGKRSLLHGLARASLFLDKGYDFLKAKRVRGANTYAQTLPLVTPCGPLSRYPPLAIDGDDAGTSPSLSLYIYIYIYVVLSCARRDRQRDTEREREREREGEREIAPRNSVQYQRPD